MSRFLGAARSAKAVPEGVTLVIGSSDGQELLAFGTISFRALVAAPWLIWGLGNRRQISESDLRSVETPASGLAGLGWHQGVGMAILAGIIKANEAKRADSRRRDRLSMPGERRLYNTRKGKAVAHRLWRCFHTPGTSLPLAPGRGKAVSRESP
ncbi:MAG: hypothetical protein R3D51_19500 [Hyphomicrobiaceae bacterium]